MLLELSISNLAIIDSFRLQFGPRLNLLTGETGTGKSIIIDAVSLLLGGRASAEMIRTGAERTVVEGVFALSPDSPLGVLLQEQDLAGDADQLILRREISRTHRNICRVNGHAVPTALLAEIGRHLIDIHGQGDHLSLLRVRHHVDFLDRFGGLLDARGAFGAMVRELRSVREGLQSLRRDAREVARRVDLLEYQIGEIGSARLQLGEEDELKRRRSLLANAERRTQLAASAFSFLYEGGNRQRAVTDLLGSTTESLAELAKLDDSQVSTSQTAEGILYQLEDLARNLRRYRDEVEYAPEELEAVEERLDSIQNLKRKYGGSIAEILAFAEQAQRELESIGQTEAQTEAFTAREHALLEQLGAAGAMLSEARRVAAESLRAAIEGELAELNMGRARLLIDVQRVEAADGVPVDGRSYAFDATGIDRVQFLITPNPGEEPKPLVKIASGGETSRLMLALKTALSAIDPVPTLVFDEIDTGIGGRTGSVVGHKLWTLAREHQVFCVTHLAQIACYADTHFSVSKAVVQDRTISVVEELGHRDRVDELAVLLGGSASEANRQSAEELIRGVSGLEHPAPPKARPRRASAGGARGGPAPHDVESTPGAPGRRPSA